VQVLAGRAASGQGEIAGEVADSRSQLRVGCEVGDAEDLGPACGRAQQIEQDPNRRRLSGTVWPDEAEDLSPVDLQINAVQSPEGAVVFHQAFDADD
jgi:hypothetical protein